MVMHASSPFRVGFVHSNFFTFDQQYHMWGAGSNRVCLGRGVEILILYSLLKRVGFRLRHSEFAGVFRLSATLLREQFHSHWKCLRPVKWTFHMYLSLKSCCSNLRRSLLRFSTRPNEWGTQWDSNSLV